MIVKRILKSSLGVTTLTILGSIISFLNQVIIARYFGAAQQVDNYLSAISYPTFLAGLLGTIISYSMVPNIAKFNKHSKEQVEYIRSVGIVTISIGIIVGSLGCIVALFQLLYFNLSQEVFFITIFAWITAMMQIILSLLSAISTAYGRFYRPIIVNLFYYMFMIIITILLHESIGISSVALGLLIGTIVSTIFLGVSNKEELVLCMQNRNFNKKIAILFLKDGPIVAIAMTCFSSYAIIDAKFASSIGESNLSYLGYSQRILIGVGNLVIAGPSAIFVPHFARMIGNEEIAKFRKQTYKVLGIIFSLALPIACIGSIFANFIITVLFKRGAFDEMAVQGVSHVLSIMIFGMVPMLCVVILFRIYYCLNVKYPQMIVGLCWSTLYIVGSYIALFYKNITITAVTYVASWIVCLALLIILFEISIKNELKKSKYIRGMKC